MPTSRRRSSHPMGEAAATATIPCFGQSEPAASSSFDDDEPLCSSGRSGRAPLQACVICLKPTAGRIFRVMAVPPMAIMKSNSFANRCSSATPANQGSAGPTPSRSCARRERTPRWFAGPSAKFLRAPPSTRPAPARNCAALQSRLAESSTSSEGARGQGMLHRPSPRKREPGTQQDSIHHLRLSIES